MVWNKDLPADSTKIRDLGVVIRDNNTAIQTGDSTFQPQALNLIDRASVAPPISNVPATIALTNIVYSRLGAVSGLPEFYSINPTYDTQVTHAGRIGSPTTGATVSGLKYLTKTYDNAQANMVSAWAQCAGAGGFSGFAHSIATCTHNSTGNYTITTSPVFINASVGIMLTCHAGAADVRVANWVTKSYALSVLTVNVTIVNENASPRDEDFDIMIVGGI